MSSPKQPVTPGLKIATGCFLLLTFVLPIKSFSEPVFELEDPSKHLAEKVIRGVDGERINLLTGEVGYYREDFAIPGNGPTIRLGRKYRREYGYPFAFRNMSMEIPRISFTVAGSFMSYTQEVCNHNGCGPDYSVPPVDHTKTCTGLKLYDNGRFVPGGPHGDHTWERDLGDLFGGIKFTIGESAINFYPRETILVQSARFPTEAEYVSPDNWYINCDGTTWNVHAPDGTTYILDEFEHMPTTGGGMTVFVTSIIDSYDNTLTYNYDSRVMVLPTGGFNGNGEIYAGPAFYRKYLTSITANDGRALNIVYNSDNTVQYITDNNSSSPRRLDYTYHGEGAGLGLNKVTRQDGTFWQYEFAFGSASITNIPTARWSEFGAVLSSVKTPEGLQIDYNYLGHDPRFHTDNTGNFANEVVDDTFFYEAQDAPFRPALVQRSLSGPGLSQLQSTLHWYYEYYKNVSTNDAITFVRAPANSTKYTFRRLDLFNSLVL